MRAGRFWIVSAVVALGALAGCAGSEPETPEKPAPVTTTAAGNAFLEPGLQFPEEAAKAYREALAKVDKKLAADDDALDYGKNTCLDIEQGKTSTQVETNAAGRFEVDAITAKEIVKAVKSGLCAK